MATATSTRPLSATQKMRPPPPPIQTSSATMTSSPSPSVAFKRPPSIPRQQLSAGIASASTGVSSTRPARQRKESQRQAQARSMSRALLDGVDRDGSGAALEKPLVVDTKYILHKWKGCPPSLVVHLHPTLFRFDQQDGGFGYSSPMKVFLEHLRSETLPHDMIEELHRGGVNFYDGCLIVEVHNHRKIARNAHRETQEKSTNLRDKAFSVHKSNKFLTPSPYVPYPSPNSTPSGSSSPPDKVQLELNADVPLPGTSPNRGSTFTTVLHPTSLSRYADVLIEATTIILDSRTSNKKGQAVPREANTPASTYPPTPVSAALTPVMGKGHVQKRQRMRLEENGIHNFESEMLKNTENGLLLDPAENFEDAQAILRALTHPLHNQEPPRRKGRKRTVAQLAADEAEKAEEERIAMILDSRLNPSLAVSGSGTTGAGEGRDAAKLFEPDFSRFKAMEDIKNRQQEEAFREKQEQLTRKEQERHREQAQAHMAAQLKQRTLEEERLKRERMANYHPNQPQMRAAANPMRAQMVENLLAQQNSQGQHSSPLTAANSPNHSSPLVANGLHQGAGPMTNQAVNSPRPGSGMQMHSTLTQATSRQMSQQPSQASQSRTNTPQIPNMTPHMGNAMPNMQATPQMRATQGSPPMGMPNPQMHGMGAGAQINSPQYLQMMQQHKLNLQRQHAQAQAQAQGPIQGQHPQMANQINLQQRAAQQQSTPQLATGLRPGMGNAAANPQLMANYRRQMALQAETFRQEQQRMRQNGSSMSPTTTSGAFSNMSMTQTMGRHPSQQQVYTHQQQQQMHQSPHIQRQPSNPNQPTPQQNHHSPVSSSNFPLDPTIANRQAAAQQQMAQLQRQKEAFFISLDERNGGQRPSNAEHKWQEYLQKLHVLRQQNMARAGMGRQMQTQGQQMGQQGQQGQQGQANGFHGQMSPGQGQGLGQGQNLGMAMQHQMGGNMQGVNMQNRNMNQGQNQGQAGGNLGMDPQMLRAQAQYQQMLQSHLQSQRMMAQGRGSGNAHANAAMMARMQQQQQQGNMGMGLGMGMQGQGGMGRGGG